MLYGLSENIQQIKNMKVAVVGDYCIDRYLYSDAQDSIKYDYSEKSTSVIKSIRNFPGGAGNVVNNFCSLGAQVYCVGIIGDDGDGYDLKCVLQDIGANTDYLIADKGRKTVACIRPIINNDSCSRVRELMCVNQVKPSRYAMDYAMGHMMNIFDSVDAIVIVEQFDKPENGLLNNHFKEFVAKYAFRNPKKIIIADSRDYINSYKNILLKCNQFELLNVCGHRDNLATNDVLKLLKMNVAMFVTQGENGIMFYSAGESYLIPSIPVYGPIYTCGAGDAATVGIVSGLYLGYNYFQSAMLGNLIASITIKQLDSTGVATIDDVMNASYICEKNASA